MKVLKERLSGRYYHKQTRRGLILMVEYVYGVVLEADIDAPSAIERNETEWRKATPADLVELKLK